MAQEATCRPRQEPKPSQRYRHSTDALTVPVHVDVRTYRIEYAGQIARELNTPISQLHDAVNDWWGAPLGTFVNIGMHNDFIGMSIGAPQGYIVRVDNEETMRAIAMSSINNITPSTFYDYLIECGDMQESDLANVPAWQHQIGFGWGFGWGLVIADTKELPIKGDRNGYSMYGSFVQSMYEDAMGVDDLAVWASDEISLGRLEIIRKEITKLESIIT